MTRRRKTKRKKRTGPALGPRVAAGGASGTFAPNSKETKRFREECGLEPLNDSYAADLICLRCDREFHSEDRRKFRVCDRCKTTPDWRQGASLDDNELQAGRSDTLPQAIVYKSEDRGAAHRARLSRTFIKKNRTTADQVAKRLEAILREENS